MPELPRGDYRRGRHGFLIVRVLHRLRDGSYPEVGDRDAAFSEPVAATPVPQEGDWWEHAYAGGPMVKVPGFPRPLYPPDTPPKSGHQPSTKGPDVIAYKRTICRLGRWDPWDPEAWDEQYSNAFSHGRGSGQVGDTGVAGVQRQQGLDDTGWLGEKTFNVLRSARVPEGPHAGEMAMDSVAVSLIEDAWQIAQEPLPSPADVDDVKAAMVDYCTRCIRNEPDIHYSQARAMTHLGKSPDSEFTADCSGHSTSTYYWARQVTGLAVPDPNRYCAGFGGYNGYGWTGSLVAAPKASAPYKVGDLAIYGDSTSDTSHVCTCYEAGDAQSAEWCSHGSEAAPYGVELHYRSDLVKVCRPGLMP